jgi:hypothetical protein
MDLAKLIDQGAFSPFRSTDRLFPIDRMHPILKDLSFCFSEHFIASDAWLAGKGSCSMVVEIIVRCG